jgi:peptidoglycan/xylan/chitin deacetylase (PgdA/CDA1 family)
VQAEYVINLTFHGIGSPGRCVQPGERRVWVSEESFHALAGAAAGRGDVRITFDDGNESDVRIALPTLHSLGIVATFFVVAGLLGKRGYLDSAGLRALADAGMPIGTHGMWHRPWRGLDERSLSEELLEARERLEDIVQRPVADAACPFGAYDRRVLRRLRGCGYRRVYTSDRGAARRADWLQARNTVRSDEGAELLAALGWRRAPHTRWLRQATLAAKRWR